MWPKWRNFAKSGHTGGETPKCFFSRMCAAEILSLKKTEVPLNHFESAAEEGRRRQLCSGERKQERKSLELSRT